MHLKKHTFSATFANGNQGRGRDRSSERSTPADCPPNHMKTKHQIPLALLVGVLVAGCATSNFRKADTTSTTLHDAALRIDHTLAPLDLVAAALSDLVNHPEADRAPQFSKFSTAVTDFEAQVGRLAAQADGMQANNAAYLKQWEAELATIENADIQQRSQERKVEVANRMKRVRQNYLRASMKLSPFLSDLRDLRTALSTDLTAGGVDSIRGLEKKVTAEAKELRASLIELSVDFKSLGISLSPLTT